MVIVTTMPILVIYPFLQKCFIRWYDWFAEGIKARFEKEVNMDAYKGGLSFLPEEAGGNPFNFLTFLADDFENTFMKSYSKLKGCSPF